MKGKCSGADAVRRNLQAIAASVVVVGAVQWLVRIADQMEQELEREQPFLKVRIRVFQLDCELIDFVHHAGVRRPIRCQRAGWQS